MFVGRLTEHLGNAQGGFCKVIGTVGGRWIGVPWCTGGGLRRLPFQRLAEAGAQEFPKTSNRGFPRIGAELEGGRPPLRPDGRSHLQPGWSYPYMWSWGGKELEADGKTVVLNTKETVDLGEVRRRAVERDDGRGRACLG